MKIPKMKENNAGMKINKGEYGYRDSHKKMRVFLTGLLTAAILAQLIARSFTDSQATKNILTVMAILTVLPMANMASPLIASGNTALPPKPSTRKWFLMRRTERCFMI